MPQLFEQFRKGTRGAGVPFLVAMMTMPVLFSGEARGERYDLIPSLAVKEEYNDNIFFSSSAPDRAFVTTLSPRVELAAKDERLEATLVAGVDEIIYRDRGGSVSALNQKYRGRTSYLLDPRLKFELNAAYTIDHRPDRNLEKDGIVINAVGRDYQNYSAAAYYALAEKSSANFSYLYQQEDFNGLELSNNRIHGAGAGYVHDLRAYLPAMNGRANFNFTRYEFTSSMADNYSATLGLGWSISETWEVSADAGGRYTDAEFDVESDSTMTRESNSGLGWVARAAVSVRGEKDKGTLTYNRDVTVASSRSGTTESDKVDLDYRHSFSPDFSASLALGYQASRSMGSSLRIDEEYLRFNAGLQYQINRNMAVDTSYSYLTAKYRQSGTTADRNSILVSLTVRYPFLDQW
ncbi:MAG: outer membrane beta-barrel protein [Geobacteraceae bacterium]|nr:outer membrane beta-barrel protein [Geobacteraceae bacterium]